MIWVLSALHLLFVVCRILCCSVCSFCMLRQRLCLQTFMALLSPDSVFDRCQISSSKCRQNKLSVQRSRALSSSTLPWHLVPLQERYACWFCHVSRWHLWLGLLANWRRMYRNLGMYTFSCLYSPLALLNLRVDHQVRFERLGRKAKLVKLNVSETKVSTLWCLACDASEDNLSSRNASVCLLMVLKSRLARYHSGLLLTLLLLSHTHEVLTTWAFICLWDFCVLSPSASCTAVVTEVMPWYEQCPSQAFVASITLEIWFHSFHKASYYCYNSMALLTPK